METKTSQPLELFPAPPKQLLDDPEIVYSQEFLELLSTFPKEKNVFGVDIYQYNGFWFTKLPLYGIIESLKHFEPRKNDVFLVTAPKSGTTWLKAIIYTLLNRQVHHPQDPHHPLLTNTPHQLVPFLVLLKPSEYDSISNSPDSSTRIFGAHLPVNGLPKSVIEDNGSYPSSICIENAFDLYSRGVSGSGPVWDQIIGYWNESLKRPHKVLFMRYEDMIKEPHCQLRRLALFLGKPVSEEEENIGLLDQIVSLCSIDNLKNLQVNKSGTDKRALKNDTFFRSGKVGDWNKYLTAEMAAKLDHITQDKFHGSGLSL
ncbi:Sulfotransferase [Heracleum sosnowskyi]|uniref:Sulfotransferase n=1 Tax=Heracleum sosnowskyi TaxID=360622 RepID=A0AAD8HZ55_9APIA|nr:Sulfotransferase [Heracleum sosnowskyi]